MLTREDGMIDAEKETDERTQHPRRTLGTSRGGGEVHAPGVAARSESQGGEQPGAAAIGGNDSRRDPDVDAERLLREFEERRSRKRAEIEPRRAATLNPTPSEVHFTQDSQDSQTPLDHQDSQGTDSEIRKETAERPDLFPDSSLPLHLFILAAADSETLWFEEELATAEYPTLPKWKKGWHFVRLLRGHPELRDLDSLTALRKVNLLLGELDSQGWSCYEEIDCEESDFDATFLRCWAAIRSLPGEKPLDSAVRLANRYPLKVGEGELSYYCKVLSVTGWLQVVVGDRPISLATRMLADLVGCSPRSISTYLKLAVDQGFLDLVKKHPLKSVGGMAYEYRFHTERWPILKNGPPREEAP